MIKRIFEKIKSRMQSHTFDNVYVDARVTLQPGVNVHTVCLICDHSIYQIPVTEEHFDRTAENLAQFLEVYSERKNAIIRQLSYFITHPERIQSRILDCINPDENSLAIYCPILDKKVNKPEYQIIQPQYGVAILCLCEQGHYI